MLADSRWAIGVSTGSCCTSHTHKTVLVVGGRFFSVTLPLMDCFRKHFVHQRAIVKKYLPYSAVVRRQAKCGLMLYNLNID